MVLDLHRLASAYVIRLLLALVVLAIGVPVELSARLSPPQQTTGVIIGTVSERGSLQPIAQALVVVSGTDRSATTNASGQFRITNLAPGTRELEVMALGYQSISTEPLTIALDSEARVTITMESQPLVVDRLIVTATKTARSSEDVTALITVVEREEIDARGDLELVDALESAPGLMHTAQAGSFESIELRGMPREGNEFESTLLLIDGVPQTDSRNSARVINLPIDNADAVEIVHGPNSALYGRTRPRRGDQRHYRYAHGPAPDQCGAAGWRVWPCSRGRQGVRATPRQSRLLRLLVLRWEQGVLLGRHRVRRERDFGLRQVRGRTRREIGSVVSP